MENVKVYIRRWIGYFYIADMKRILQSWNEWLRRRMRMYIWKGWKKPKTKVQNMRKLGIPERQAYQMRKYTDGILAMLSRSITNKGSYGQGIMTSLHSTSVYDNCT
ncbi:group II intron maturase-specific domain-containing protein [Paenibacillus terrae]|uniref:group II intron maturase-specific domain-containing protein n=1 Tax=Paenibacillus terrae TaxID=159743 RepID=UPI00399478C7